MDRHETRARELMLMKPGKTAYVILSRNNGYCPKCNINVDEYELAIYKHAVTCKTLHELVNNK